MAIILQFLAFLSKKIHLCRFYSYVFSSSLLLYKTLIVFFNLLSPPLCVRRWLLFKQNNGEQYSATADSRLIHYQQSIATYRPRCHPSADRHTNRYLGGHVDQVSADISTDMSANCQSTHWPKVSTDRGLYYT